MEKPVLYLPRPVADWLPSRPWLEVRPKDQAALVAGGTRVKLGLCPIQPPADDSRFVELLPALTRTAPSERPLVTAGYLRRSIRTLLEERSIGYLDARGHFHLPWAGGVLHVEDPASEARGKATAQPGVGPGSVRAIQAVLSEKGPILVSLLAKRARLSLSQTHAALKLLELEGFVRATGSGPATRREVLDRTRLLDWLAGQPAARRRTEALDVSLYARTPEEAWKRIAKGLGGAKIEHGITGAAGAAVHGAGPSNVPLTAVRIDPKVPLAEAARTMGAEVVDRGANVRLLRDNGQLGCVDAENVRGILLAPRPRIYIDVLSDRRGEDIAQHFREAILGY